MDRLTQELTDCQWWPIADFLPLENDKFGYTDRQIDGHNLPAHQCLFGYYDKATWKVETHGEQRNIHTFDIDERDGTKEDDLFGLAELNFVFTDEEAKEALKRVRKWWRPDQVARRTIYERKQDPECSEATLSFSPDQARRANKKSIWRQRAANLLQDKWCKMFWEFIMRRRLGLVRFFLPNQQTLAEA